MTDINTLLIGLVCLVLIGIVLYEMFKDQQQHVEGFDDSSNYFNTYYPKRKDVLPGQTVEDGGWVRDLRYKEQYVDVQKIGMSSDLCRVVMKPDDPGSMIMACALAGTDGTPSRTYRTKSKAEGFIFGRDDYFKDAKNNKGRTDYCRIVKIAGPPSDAWISRCVMAGSTSFKPQEIKDANPPQHILDILWFYEGIMLWYRFRDDIVDYARNTRVGLAGGITIDQDPTKIQTQGLQINHVPQMLLDSPGAAEQFIRIGETKDLEFETDVELRQLRSFSCWVFFDMFTNNARIFDFGNGAGHDNVFLGIEGKGNDSAPLNKKPQSLTLQAADDDIVCNRSAPREISPQQYMKMTEANVELYECPGPEPVDRATGKIPDDSPIEIQAEQAQPKRANLLFEIWDKSQRKMRMRVVDAVQEQKWHHIALTTADTAFRPSWQVYVDGKMIFSNEDGHLPQVNYTSKNYIGRSNWEDSPGQGEFKDERFRGSLFDFRMYRIPISVVKIQKTMDWGAAQLGLNIKAGPNAAQIRKVKLAEQQKQIDDQRKQLEKDKAALELEKKTIAEKKQGLVVQKAVLAQNRQDFKHSKKVNKIRKSRGRSRGSRSRSKSKSRSRSRSRSKSKSRGSRSRSKSKSRSRSRSRSKSKSRSSKGSKIKKP